MFATMLKAMIKAVVPRHWRRRMRALQWRIESVWGPGRGLRALRSYRAFRKDLRRYRVLPGAERIDSVDLWPCLFDKTETTPFDVHYFYQDSWAARRILQTHPKEHVDVGSNVHFVVVLSAHVPVLFVDIRPLDVALPNLNTMAGSLLRLPFPSGSVPSLSCLHVIEHVGLGRYGDPFDPQGTKKAARELARVLASGGNLFVGAPIGRERCCFNAHRVHCPQTILRYFEGLALVEFSCVVGEGKFYENADPENVDLEKSACGLFWFTKRNEGRTRDIEQQENPAER